MKKIRYFFEWVLVAGAYYFFQMFSIDTASKIGGRIARNLGPWFKAHRIARLNLEKSFPEFSEETLEEILDKMWDNLGRYMGEFSHITNLSGAEFTRRVELEGAENIEEMKSAGRGGILFSGHFANLEILPKTAYEYGMPLSLIYRPANNKLVNNFLLKVRKKSHVGMFAKGKEAARGVVLTLKEKKYAAMLVDQKMNDGIKLKFFGRDAMTAPAMARMAIKYDCVLLPAVVQRKAGAYFKVKVFPAMEIKKTEDFDEDCRKVMQDVNDLLESWIKQRPEEWFWVHNRWMK